MSAELASKSEKEHQGFKDKYSFEARAAEAKKKIQDNPTLIPLVVEKLPRSRLPTLDRFKFLVADDLKFYEFQFNIKTKLKLDKRDSLYFFVANKKINKPNITINEIYNENKDKDGFLYISYTELETFGA